MADTAEAPAELQEAPAEPQEASAEIQELPAESQEAPAESQEASTEPQEASAKPQEASEEPQEATPPAPTKPEEPPTEPNLETVQKAPSTEIPAEPPSEKDTESRKSSKTSKEIKDVVSKETSSIEDGKKGSTLLSTESFDSKKRSPTLSKDDSRKLRQGRLSRMKDGLHSIISIRRLSMFPDPFDKKGARFMNTYKLDSDNPFKPDKVKVILEAVMIEAMENLTYDADKCSKLAKWASGAIRTKVKDLQFDRYKIISLVTFGEKNAQDVLITCRFLWDVDRDRYATFSIENSYVFGIAQCFGIYYE